jgi:hypothetical protein
MNITSRPGSGNGAGFSNTELTTEKIACIRPDSQGQGRHSGGGPGLCRKMRSECRMS